MIFGGAVVPVVVVVLVGAAGASSPGGGCVGGGVARCTGVGVVVAGAVLVLDAGPVVVVVVAVLGVVVLLVGQAVVVVVGGAAVVVVPYMSSHAAVCTKDDEVQSHSHPYWEATPSIAKTCCPLPLKPRSMKLCAVAFQVLRKSLPFGATASICCCVGGLFMQSDIAANDGVARPADATATAASITHRKRIMSHWSDGSYSTLTHTARNVANADQRQRARGARGERADVAEILLR